MNRIQSPSVPNTRRRNKNPLEGVTKGWPCIDQMRREAEVRARDALPYIVLEGKWLRECGFEIGQAYKVQPENGLIRVEAVVARTREPA